MDVSFKYLPGRSSGTVMMLLAVNLILLSVFIMLNALATRSEDKSKHAALSLQKGVASAPPAGVEAAAETNRKLRLWQVQKQERLEELTKDKIQPSELVIQVDQASVEATLPLSMFFADGAAQLKMSGQAMLENFTASMVGQGYMRVLVYMPEASALLAAQRAGLLRNMLDEALPPGSPAVEVGFSEGEPRLVLLLIPPVEIRQNKPRESEAK